MSKSLGNHIGINEPPEEIYGKTMSVADELMAKYFELATEVPEAEIKRLAKLIEAGEMHPKEAKQRLAREIVALYHGEEAGPLPAFERPEGWGGIDLPEMAGEGPQVLGQAQLDAVRTNLRRAASEVLTAGRVGVVIGYGAGSLPNQAVPVLITETADCEKLEWGRGCRNNLSTYIGSALEKHERVAVIAKTCDLGAISGLVREGQLQRDQLLVIGVQCSGVTDRSGLATKCLACSGKPHPVCDLVVTVEGLQESCEDPKAAALDTPDTRDEQIAHLESLPHDERWKFWQRQFGRCLRCYACRAACPLCYCSSCIAEKHRPQWVPTAIDNAGNSTWNIIRAVHLAGRCSGCDECARVCPADIRLDLINRKLALEVERQYGKVGLDPEQKSALVDFRMEDSEEFIL